MEIKSGVKARFFVYPTPEDYVRSAINTIGFVTCGFVNITCGFWAQELHENFFQMFLCFPLQNFLRNKIKELHSGINLD